MAETKKSSKSSAKKYGARYGRTVKDKFAKIEKLQHQSYNCPFCSYPKVKRVSMGIWACEKCKAKFTSKAFTVAKTTSQELGLEEAELPSLDDE